MADNNRDKYFTSWGARILEIIFGLVLARFSEFVGAVMGLLIFLHGLVGPELMVALRNDKRGRHR